MYVFKVPGVEATSARTIACNVDVDGYSLAIQ